VLWDGQLPDSNCSVIVLQMDQNVETISIVNNSTRNQ